MRRDGIAIALNALANASREPVSEADLLPILATGDGPGHLVRALFGDCSFDTLDRLGATLGLSRDRVRQVLRPGQGPPRRRQQRPRCRG